MVQRSSLRRPMLFRPGRNLRSQERKRKKKSACFARFRKPIRNAKDAPRRGIRDAKCASRKAIRDAKCANDSGLGWARQCWSSRSESGQAPLRPARAGAPAERARRTLADARFEIEMVVGAARGIEGGGAERAAGVALEIFGNGQLFATSSAQDCFFVPFG